jgi:predicted small secreted protein
MIMIRKFLSVALAAWIALLAGCHTMQGLGEDIERAGEKIQDKAKK